MKREIVTDEFEFIQLKINQYCVSHNFDTFSYNCFELKYFIEREQSDNIYKRLLLLVANYLQTLNLPKNMYFQENLS